MTCSSFQLSLPPNTDHSCNSSGNSNSRSVVQKVGGLPQFIIFSVHRSWPWRQGFSIAFVVYRRCGTRTLVGHSICGVIKQQIYTRAIPPCASDTSTQPIKDI